MSLYVETLKLDQANEDKLKFAGFWGAPEEAAPCPDAAADPDPLDLAASGGQSLGVEGPALHLKACAIRLRPRKRFQWVLPPGPLSAGSLGGRSS